jgi:hypothetical protein
MKNCILFIVFILAVTLFPACKPKEKAYRGPLFDRSPEFLFNKMRENEFRYDWITAKISAEVNDDGKRTSFKTAVRAKKDSVIWASISPALGIEVARMVITKDSVHFMNRLNSTYFEGDFNFINNYFGVDVDFDMLQSILTGNAFAHFEEDEFKSFVDKDQYMLSTVRKRKLRKKIQKSDTLDLVAQSIWLEPRTFKISKFGIYDFAANKSLEVFYSNFTTVEHQLFPFKLFFIVKSDKANSELSLQYSKVSHEGPQSIPFTVPEKYEPLH